MLFSLSFHEAMDLMCQGKEFCLSVGLVPACLMDWLEYSWQMLFRRGGGCLDCWGGDGAAQGESRLFLDFLEWYWLLGYHRLEAQNVTHNMKLSKSLNDRYWACCHLLGWGISLSVWRVGAIRVFIPGPWPSLCLEQQKTKGESLGKVL